MRRHENIYSSIIIIIEGWVGLGSLHCSCSQGKEGGGSSCPQPGRRWWEGRAVSVYACLCCSPVSLSINPMRKME